MDYSFYDAFEGLGYGGIHTMDAETLMNSPIKKNRFIVEGLIPEGVTLISGASKIGKSWLVLDLALCVSQGIPFWRLETAKSDVLYLCLEDSFSRIQDRLFQIADTAPDNLYFGTTCGQLGGGLEQEFKTFKIRHENIRLLIIDTLQKACGAKDKYNGGMYANDYKDMSALKNLAAKERVVIILVHHLRKQSDNDPFNQISGTTGIMGAVDTSLILSKDSRFADTGKLIVTGRDVEEQQFMLRFENLRWVLIEKKGATEMRKEVIPNFLFQLVDFMVDRAKWSGNATELLAELHDKEASPNSATKLITKYYYEVLEPKGIFFKTKRTGDKRLIILSKSDDCDGDDDE